mmetsp:Transcript_60833/g.195983  ORF Transcript_60833/g.195983 Transcript_60833/m.195983 type:complete len:261 (+) Transcript_60833:1427-2209(+)
MLRALASMERTRGRGPSCSRSDQRWADGVRGGVLPTSSVHDLGISLAAARWPKGVGPRCALLSRGAHGGAVSCLLAGLAAAAAAKAAAAASCAGDRGGGGGAAAGEATAAPMPLQARSLALGISCEVARVSQGGVSRGKSRMEDSLVGASHDKRSRCGDSRLAASRAGGSLMGRSRAEGGAGTSRMKSRIAQPCVGMSRAGLSCVGMSCPRASYAVGLRTGSSAARWSRAGGSRSGGSRIGGSCVGNAALRTERSGASPG